MNAREREHGFTLIELLVVILIIAILAAIAIPVFLSQREKGWVSQVQSSLKNAATAAESYGTGNNGIFTGLTPAVLVSEGFKTSSSVAIGVDTSDSDTKYCITATHNALDSTHPWQIATYNSDDGSPLPANSDTC